MNIDVKQFSAVVDSIYASALEPTRWPKALSNLSALFGVEKALLFTAQLRPAQGGFAFLHGLTEHSLQKWVSKYIEHDIWTRETIAKGFMRDGAVVLDHELCSDQALTESLYYREFLLEQDIRHLCAGVIFGAESAPYPMTGLSLYKSHSAGRFTEHDRQVVSLLVGHLSRALGTMYRLGDLELKVASSYAALDLLRVGVMLIGARGNVLFTNKAARRSLCGDSGLSLFPGNPLRDAEGWITLKEAALQLAVEGAIRLATRQDPSRAGHMSTGIQVPRTDGHGTNILQIAPLAEQNEFSRRDRSARAIVFINDSAAALDLDTYALRTLYGLTHAEIRVAHALLTAESLGDVACKMGNSENTIKKHVQALFTKTNTSRQAELIRLLLSLPARK